MSDFNKYLNSFKCKRLQKAYKLQGSMNFQGLDIKIENRVGSVRHWKQEDGEEGKTKMHTRYGYIAKSLGVDGDAVDVFVSDINPESDKVFVIHQKVPKTNKYDEDKCMLGFDTEEQAIEEYKRHYSTDFFDSCEELTMEEFKRALVKLRGHKIQLSKLEKSFDLFSRKDTEYILDSNGNPILNKASISEAIFQYSGLRKSKRSNGIPSIGKMSKATLLKAVLSKDRFVLAQLKFKNKK